MKNERRNSIKGKIDWEENEKNRLALKAYRKAQEKK